MRILIGLILCLALLFGAAEPGTVTQAQTVFGQVQEESAPLSEDDSALWPEYYRYDSEDFYDGCQKLPKLKNPDAVIELYDRLYGQYLTVSTLASVAYVNHCRDITDTYWTEEYEWYDMLYTDCGDRLCSACSLVLSGSCADAFAAHVGQSDADILACYVEYTDEEQQLLQREQELIAEYYEQYDARSALRYTYNGREYSFDELETGGETLYNEDPDAYFAVYDGLTAELNSILGGIYLELVQLRDRIAHLEGYDSYTDYAYEMLYERDYSPAEAALYCREVKENIAREYMNEVPAGGYFDSDADASALIDALGDGAEQMDESIYDAWLLMTENDLYDLDSGDGRQDGAYTVTLDRSGTAFIFQTLSYTNNDFSGLTHEFGHFVNACAAPNPNILTRAGSYDLFEIHSTGLEMLYIPYYSGLFGDMAWAAEYSVVENKLDCVISGCLYDEFQQAVYADPDMTLDEINRLFCQLSESYGIYEGTDTDGSWIYISHNFESPLYYISYSVSSLVAIQLWDESCRDYDSAVDHWLQLVNLGAYDAGYCSVLQSCGLDCFTESGTATEICRRAMDYLENF